MSRPVSKRQPERVFLPYEVSIAKKALKLEEFMADNVENVTNFDAWRFKTLETQIASLRTQVLRMETDWDEMRDATMPAAAFDKISKLVDDSMATGEEAIERADKFMCLRLERTQQAKVETGQRDKTLPIDPQQEATGKHDRLDNTLRPAEHLSRTMSLEEETKWLTNFESYLDWNKRIIAKRSISSIRNLLESSLDASLVSKLQTDMTVTAETEVRGEAGVLEKLKKYFFDNYPLINCRHDFTVCKQARGELFKAWWEKKRSKAVECNLKAMKEDDWLVLELIRGVSDTMLQKRMHQEHQATLAQLVLMAEQWQAADSAQTAFGSESTKYVRQASEYNRESTEYIRKASDYKHQIKENWKQDRQTNDRRSPIDKCQGCGAQGDKMHNRDSCPAANRNCYNCDIKGHFGRVCMKPPRPRNSVSKMVRVAETHGGSTNPTS
jgi:hypothetical protein